MTIPTDTTELRDTLAEILNRATKKWWKEEYGTDEKIVPWNQLDESGKLFYRRLAEAAMDALRMGNTNDK